MAMNKKKTKYNYIVIGITAIIFLAVFLFSQINNDGFMTTINRVLNFLYDKLGWFFNLATLSAIFFAAFFLFSKYGNIKIGGRDAKPEFSKFKWWAISLCSGMGMGIVFFPPAEAIEYAFRPATGLGLEPGSYEAIVWSMQQTMMHWSVTLYGVYVVGGILAAYCFYNLKQPFSISATLYPLFGKKIYKYRSWIDGIVNFAIVGGVAGSFGYGILQVSDGLNQVLGTPKNNFVYTVIAIGITVVATITSVTGIKKGIQWLSDQNAKLFIVLLVFVAIFGPTVFSLNLGVESTGGMITNFFSNMTLTEPMGGDGKWSIWWNWLWYIDFFIFAPTTGMFLARLGRGRTLKEFVTVNLVAPSVFTIIWCWFFGGLAVHAQLTGAMDLNSIMLQRGTEAVMLSLFDLLPFSKVFKVFMLVIVLISFITLVNAIINTVAKMSIKTSSREEEEADPPRGIQIFWGILIGGVSLLFCVAGGIDGAKAVKMLVGIPIVFLECMAMWGMVRMFRKKKYKEVKEIEPGVERENKDNGITKVGDKKA